MNYQYVNYLGSRKRKSRKSLLLYRVYVFQSIVGHLVRQFFLLAQRYINIVYVVYLLEIQFSMHGGQFYQHRFQNNVWHKNTRTWLNVPFSWR